MTPHPRDVDVKMAHMGGRENTPAKQYQGKA
jgi:hypothetical protein